MLILLMARNTLAVAPYSKPGCQETCGILTIPYPFGIGSKSCYHDEWFEIVCQNSTAYVSQSVPFLKKLNLQVLKFTLPSSGNLQPGTIDVNSPIISSDCNGSNSKATTGPAVDLSGSTFVFSQLMNHFAAVGRNSRVVMKNVEPDLIGCIPSTRNCSGVIMNCCEISIPSDLKVFNVDFESLNGTVEECKYGFIVVKDWFSYGFPEMETEWLQYNSSTVFSALPCLQIPAILEWTLSNWEGERWESDDTSTCQFHFVGSQEYPNIDYCYCHNGFEGNPYLVNGCHDVNECEYMRGGCHDACENTYGGYKCRYSRWKLIIIALVPVLGLLFVVSGVWKLYKFIKRRRVIKMKKRFFQRNGGFLLKQRLSSCEGSVENRLFTSKELEKATDNFNENRILGQGGQGTVYKGMLSDGRIVAVKKSKIEDQGEIETFINEVVILSHIIHRNIVKLQGCCLETEVPLLVYEFIPNGTLSQYLHDQIEEISVSWEMRLQIAIEVAGALSYLHSAASVPIYHRDIKSANILLDDKYRAKIADFGTSRSVADDQTHLTTLVHGTFGYLDPEYFQSSQFTDKSDVYSYGVVLVELLTGQKAISPLRIESGVGLATYFIIQMEENRLFDIVDTRFVKLGKEDEIVAVANLAKRCLHLNGRNRPAMREVHMELERIGLLQMVSEHEEVDSVTSQETENWDTYSAPTLSGFDCFVASSADEQPLVFNQTW